MMNALSHRQILLSKRTVKADARIVVINRLRDPEGEA